MGKEFNPSIEYSKQNTLIPQTLNHELKTKQFSSTTPNHTLKTKQFDSTSRYYSRQLTKTINWLLLHHTQAIRKIKLPHKPVHDDLRNETLKKCFRERPSMPAFSRAQPRPGLGIELSMRGLCRPPSTGFKIHCCDLYEFRILEIFVQNAGWHLYSNKDKGEV